MTDITDEMLRAGTAVMWGSPERDASKIARMVLEAALAGHAVVDLPEPDGYDRWAKEHIAVLAYPTGSTLGEVELIVGGTGQGMSADRAEALGLMLMAAARRSRERTQSSGVAGDTR